jgi:riboflavin biosynthesis pyrimidine reductase
LSTILRFGEKDVCLSDFSKYLFDHNMKQVLVEGGPTLLGSFFEKDLIDEMFLTIAPKIINGKTDEFLTMNEGILIPPQNVLSWNLKSIKTKGNELFLRYQRNNS